MEMKNHVIAAETGHAPLYRARGFLLSVWIPAMMYSVQHFHHNIQHFDVFNKTQQFIST